jgi:hypothetical protein
LTTVEVEQERVQHCVANTEIGCPSSNLFGVRGVTRNRGMLADTETKREKK